MFVGCGIAGAESDRAERPQEPCQPDQQEAEVVADRAVVHGSASGAGNPSAVGRRPS